MKITFKRPLVGIYGSVDTGESCDVPDYTARDLIHRGLAVLYEAKVIIPHQAAVPVEAPTPKLEAPAPKLENKRK